jgi:hypothetical protein
MGHEMTSAKKAKSIKNFEIQPGLERSGARRVSDLLRYRVCRQILCRMDAGTCLACGQVPTYGDWVVQCALHAG